MKTAIKLIGFMATVAVITFSMAACDEPDSSTSTTPAHTHTWGSWSVTTAATCSATGTGSRVCTGCGETDTNTTIPIDPDAHDWEQIEGTAATCTKTGSGKRKCTRCEKVEEGTFEIDPNAHDYGDWTTTAPTCTTVGIDTRTCSRNATHKETRAEITALGHDQGEWHTTKTASNIEEGSKELRCTRDDYVLETEAIPSIPITTNAEWSTALSELYGKTGNYTLNISGDIGVAGNTGGNTFGTTADGSTFTVTLKGNGKLYLTSQGKLINIAANQTLIIDSANLILQGLKNGQNGATQDNNASTVTVNSNANLELWNGSIRDNNSGDSASGGSYQGSGVTVWGTFTMMGGDISNNTTANYTSSGGVYIYNGTFIMTGGNIANNGSSRGHGGGVRVWRGNFTMTGGNINGNTAEYGGGVALSNWSDYDVIFTMRGGTISNNTATEGYGGGVYVSGDETIFRMSAGTIYGSNEEEGLKNIANNGAALQLNIPNSSPIAEYGTFSGETWNKSGDLFTTNNTIRVVEGVLQP